MRAMLKYSLDTGMNVLEIPGGLCGAQVQAQPGHQKPLQLWTMVETSKPVEAVSIYVAVTGEPLPAGSYYQNLGTVQMHGGSFVVHALLVTK